MNFPGFPCGVPSALSTGRVFFGGCPRRRQTRWRIGFQTQYDAKTKRAFAINSTDNDLAVIDLANPAAPILLEKVSLDAFGAGLNGVDTHDGLVAVAVEASPKTDPGKVAFIDAATLIVSGAVTVGALPDMLTFDADGRRVLVTNEGEPVSYLPGAVNPEG